MGGIGLLGPLEIDGRPVPLGPRDRVVLSALAASPGEVLAPDRLADALWHDAMPKSWSKVVQGSVMRVRRLLAPGAIETVAGGYRLTLGADDVDVHCFERLVQRGRSFAALGEPARAAVAFEQALGLWRGDPYPDLDSWDPGRAEAERLREVHRATEEDLVEAWLALGRVSQVTPQARLLVAREPFREHRWALWALGLYRSGRQREALDVVRRAGTALREELGMDPGPELTRLEEAILRQDPWLLGDPARDGQAGSARDACPYKGLRPFDPEDADDFHGREDMVAACESRLAESPLLLVVGPSGSGKSSLVRAGLVPALRRAGHRVVVVMPGADPETALAAALATAPRPTAVVVDQLEEVFSGGVAGERAAAFLAGLARHAVTEAPVVVTVRADHVGGIAASPDFARLAEQGLALLTPMSEPELRRAIEAPARRAGLLLEPGLVDLLVRDVLGEPGGLPLLSHALAETWERRDGDVLTVEGYTCTGGIRGAVAQSAERLYESLPAGDRSGLRSVLLRLVSQPATGQPVAARVPTRLLQGSAHGARLLDVLVRARLVTADADTATIAHESLVRAWPRLRTWLDEDVEGQRVAQHLQVAADGWDAMGRPDSELYRGARLQAALEWRDRTDPVLAGVEAEFLGAAAALERSAWQRQEQQLRHQRRLNRRLRAAVVGFAALLVVALVASTLATGNGRRAREEASRANAAAVAATAAATETRAAQLGASALAEPRGDVSLLLARQAIDLARTPTTEGNLVAALHRQAGLLRLVPSPAGSGYDGGILSPDGSRLLAQPLWDETVDGVFLVDTVAGTTIPPGQPLVTHRTATADDRLLPVGFVRAGRTAVVARTRDGADGRTGLELVAYDVGTGLPVGRPEPLPGSAPLQHHDALRMAPGGDHLVAALGGAVLVWARAGSAWAPPRTVAVPGLPGGATTLRGVTFAATGRLATLVLATASATDPAGSRAGAAYGVVVDLVAGRLAASPEGPRPGDAGPTALAISPDGRWVAASRGTGELDLRPLGAGWHSGLRRLTRTGSPALVLDWDATGSRLAAGLAGGEVVVLDAADPTTAGRQVVRYPGQNPVSMVAFAADSDQLVSQDASGAVAVRSLSGSTALLRSVPSDSGPARALAASPDGSVVAVGWDSGRVSLLDPSTLARVRPDLHLGLPTDPVDSAERFRVTALAFTADSEAVVAADAAGHLRMWSVHDGQVLWSRDDVPTVLLDASPDGRYLATVSPHLPGAADVHDRAATVVIWDLASRQEALRPEFGVNWDDPVALRFSPDSRHLALGLQSGPNPVFDVASGERVAAVGVKYDVVTDLAFSADGRRLILDRAGVLAAYDTRTWRQERLTLAGSRSGGPGSSIGVAPGGRFLVRGNERGEVDLVDAATLHVVAGSLPLPVGGSPRVAFGPDGTSLYVAGDRLAVWDVDPGRWMSTACDIVGRGLTKDEWDRHLPDQRYEPACRARSAA